MIQKRTILTFALFSLGMVNVLCSYLALHPVREHIFNADGLVLSALFSDLMDKGGNIKDWLLPPAGSFFPDYPIFFFAHFLSKSVYSECIIFALFQIVLTFLGTWFLLKQISKTTAFYAASAVVIGWIWLALHYPVYFGFLVLSAYHYGVFLSSLFFLALWLKDKRQHNSSNSLLWAMAIISFLSALSDTLFLVQTLIPFLGMAIFIDILEKDFSFTKKKLRILIPVVFGFLGYGSYSLIVPNDTRYYAAIGLERAIPNIKELFQFYTDIIQTPAYGLLFLSYICIVVYEFYCIIRNSDRPRIESMSWLSLFSFLSLVCTLSAMTLLTDIPLGIRYMIPLFLWPLLIVIGFAAICIKKRFFVVATLFSTLAILSLSFDTYALMKKNGLHTEYYPYEIACIDEALKKADVANGVAHFWDARPTQLFSRLDLNIAQHKYPLKEHRYVASKKSFRAAYDFIIFPGDQTISFDEVTRINGMPRLMLSCGDKTLYIYGKDQLKTKHVS